MNRATLDRRLGTRDAVVLGLASMIGAGVFSVFAPAAGAAGDALLVGLALAAAVAYCNAVASAQLAAAMPVSGGTYAYGRARLGPWWGFTAGWGFVVGKSASCAAMALTFATYLVPGVWWEQRLVAAAAVAGLALLNLRGVTRTALLSRILVSATVVALVVALVGLWGGGAARPESDFVVAGGTLGVLQSSGLLFFAFAGYARIATMGEEVRDPARTIPRAIPLALGITVLLYAAVGMSLLAVLGPAALAASSAPLDSAVRAAGAPALLPVVRGGAAVASLGALLALIAGVGRTVLAMARNRDLPRWLAAVDPVHRVPHHAEMTLAVAVGALVLTLDVRGAIGFSSFGVLVYYAIANAAAFTQPSSERRWPRAVNVAGALGCAVLVVTLPPAAVVSGVAVFAVGLLGRVVALRLRARTGAPD
ncbi:MAG: basic amino acid/polyamine antiporter, family [Microbacteriaceae bacterium]|nr:basic amino acid/polyamine antiporter, family [Microbacteriaceae bacterium]